MIVSENINRVTGQLDDIIRKTWEDLFASAEASHFFSHTMSRDKRIYAMYMIQVYHYASHTPRNLALAGANMNNSDIRLMHHCFEHAMEETGHELMALHDLKQLGVLMDHAGEQIPPALPATRAMIDFVRQVATGNEPFSILGYSYWIERPYDHILGFMQLLQQTMGLKDEQMTFYYNHMEIDKKHGDDISDIVVKVCEQRGGLGSIEEVTRVTMKYLFAMLLEIMEEYRKLISGKSDKFLILNSIVPS